jgi:hypothetical protein
MNTELFDVESEEHDIEDKIDDNAPFEEIFNFCDIVREVRCVRKVLQ